MKLFLNKLRVSLKREEDLPFHIRSSTRIHKAVMKSRIKVGRLYGVKYKGKEFTIIVIATPGKRGASNTTGVYTALNTRNRLLTCLTVDLKSSQDQLILQSIYKRERVAEYENIQSLSTSVEGLLSENNQNSPAPTSIKFSKFFRRLHDDTRMETTLNLFGKKNFKTLILNEIDDLYFLSININEEAFEDYEG